MSRQIERERGASAEAIQRHYDLGNDFYALWLDPTLTYSCALWSEGADLRAAQLNKLDWHLHNVRTSTPGSLLDIGCGWGGLMRRALEVHGFAQVTGLTLSAAQASWIEQQHIPAMQVRLKSWNQHVAPQRYDGIVSIGAFEHFARLDLDPQEKLAAYRDFFQFCHDSLHPGGRLSLQTITYENADRRDFSRFFAEEIFPQSDLPHLHEIVASVRGLFEIERLRNDRSHYERTAQHWLSALRTQRDAATQLVGTQLVRKYQQYLGLLSVAFHTGTMNLARLSLRRIDGAMLQR